MRASRQMLSELRRAFWSAGLLSGCICLLTLLAACLAAEILDAAMPLTNLQAFVVLVVLVSGCTLSIAFVSFLRDNILCRAGLWLHHELGHAVRSSRGPGSLRKPDKDRATAALDTFTAFMTSDTAGRAIQSVWAPVYVAALYFIAPFFAGIAVCGALVLACVGLWSAYGMPKIPQDVRSVRTEAEAVLLASPQSSAVQNIEAWEHANCIFVAACYAEHKRAGLAHANALAIRSVALLAALSIFAWLAAYGAGQFGTLVAGVFLLDRLVASLSAIACSAPAIKEAGTAYGEIYKLTQSARKTTYDEETTGVQEAGSARPATARSKPTLHRLTQPASQALH